MLSESLAVIYTDFIESTRDSVGPCWAPGLLGFTRVGSSDADTRLDFIHHLQSPFLPARVLLTHRQSYVR